MILPSPNTPPCLFQPMMRKHQYFYRCRAVLSSLQRLFQHPPTPLCWFSRTVWAEVWHPYIQRQNSLTIYSGGVVHTCRITMEKQLIPSYNFMKWVTLANRQLSLISLIQSFQLSLHCKKKNPAFQLFCSKVTFLTGLTWMKILWFLNCGLDQFSGLVQVFQAWQAASGLLLLWHL